MRPLSELKQDFEVSRNLGDIIDVLKTAALIQFRSFQFKEKPSENFINQTENSLNILSEQGLAHPCLIDRANLPSCIVIVTSDEGFLGELTNLLINSGIEQRKSDQDQIIVFGQQGQRYLEELNMEFLFFPGIPYDINYKHAYDRAGYLLQQYLRNYGRLYVVYPKFVSLSLQRVTTVQLLPHKPFVSDSMRQSGGAKPKISKEEMLIEPSIDNVLAGLINLYMGYKLFEIAWSAKQSEYAARIMHLEGSTQELSQLNQKLSFEYFRQIHSLRDKVIREISASKILLGKRR
ncbi:MAG: FoF1 ATP synthase subunit gamma [Candidatus Omnitrophota bacterium]